MNTNMKLAIIGAGIFSAGVGAGFLVGRKVTDGEWTAYLDEQERLMMEEYNEQKTEIEDGYTDLDPSWYDSDEDSDDNRTLINEEKPSLQDLVKAMDEPEDDEPAVEFINRRKYLSTKKGYAKRTGTYFIVDDILAGWDLELDQIDLGELLSDEEDLGRLEGMLHSDDVSAVYLRSNVLETDFEILKSDASWLEEYNDLQKDAERRIADEQGYIS